MNYCLLSCRIVDSSLQHSSIHDSLTHWIHFIWKFLFPRDSIFNYDSKQEKIPLFQVDLKEDYHLCKLILGQLKAKQQGLFQSLLDYWDDYWYCDFHARLLLELREMQLPRFRFSFFLQVRMFIFKQFLEIFS